MDADFNIDLIAAECLYSVVNVLDLVRKGSTVPFLFMELTNITTVDKYSLFPVNQCSKWLSP